MAREGERAGADGRRHVAGVATQGGGEGALRARVEGGVAGLARALEVGVAELGVAVGLAGLVADGALKGRDLRVACRRCGAPQTSRPSAAEVSDAGRSG